MKLAVVADTHDSVPAIRDLVNSLKGERIEFVVHAGDVISPFSMEELDRLGVKLYIAFGNNDGDRAMLAEIAAGKGWVIGDVVTFPFEGGGIVYHGTDAQLCEVLKNSNYRFVVLGHSHEAKVESLRDKIFLNPGEVCGYLTGKRTFALVEGESISLIDF
jgi:hypothetical protein